MPSLFSVSPESAASMLGTDAEKGLSPAAVQTLQAQFGFNELLEKKGRSAWKMFLEQFESPIIWILVIAAIISGFVGEWLQSAVILFLVLVNAVLGVRQEFQAEKAMAALKKLAAPMATVVRSGVQQKIPSRELVPGDIILIEAGDKIPADCRLVEAINLKVSEASLTGESEPVPKSIGPVSEKTSLAEQACMVFMNTEAAYGRGKGIVVATGMKTQFGQIAGLIQSIEQEKTPLAKKMEELGSSLSRIVLGIAAVIFVVELLVQLAGNGFALSAIPFSVVVSLLLVAVTLAVAAIPEGLPAVVTITLANGMNQMASKKAIIRKMAAVETLGSTQVICCDKTGTLTKNEMVVRKIWFPSAQFDVEGFGFEPRGKINTSDNQSLDNSLEGKLLLQNCWLCNNSKFDAANQKWLGDPTEIALKVLVQKNGFSGKEFQPAFSFETEVPFESERKRMSVVYRQDKKPLVFSKGSCESVLAVSDFILENGKKTALTPEKKKKILQTNDEMASKGLRVLAFAFKPELTEPKPDAIEKELVFLGLVGMLDDFREGVKEAILECQSAGIEVKMITGDHPLTAQAIAREIGLLQPNQRVVTGSELQEMSETELENQIDSIAVIARASASDKIRVVSALQKKGKVVAMTGDGINDAPALKKADIGVAMGLSGTDVSKEASDLVIQDDRFETIVAAVKEGRRVYSNIKAFVQYLLSANAAEVLVVFLGIMVWGLSSIPLLPFHLLWINLLTDGLPALALGNEKADSHIMHRKPRLPSEKITSNLTHFIVIAGIVGTLVTLGAFWFGLQTLGIEKARTLAFSTLILFELVWVFECKSPHRTVFDSNPFDNRSLNLAVLLSLVLLVLAVQLPFFNLLLQTVPLSLGEWLLVIVLSLPALFLEEGYNRLHKQWAKKES